MAKDSSEKSGGEPAEQTVRDDLELAIRQSPESIEKTEDGGLEDLHRKSEETLEQMVPGIDTTTPNTIRTLEPISHKLIMTRLTLDYFETDFPSATTREAKPLEEGDEYRFEVTGNDDQIDRQPAECLGTAEANREEAV